MFACPGSSVHLKLEEFRRTAKYSDVSILVERTFKCHRNVLAAASSYFDSMFSGNFKEGHAEELHLHDMDPDLFEEILHFMYTGGLTITSNNAFDLLCISEFLSVPTILDSCVKYTQENMHQYTVENMIKMFVWARSVNFQPLIEPVLNYISCNFINFSKNNTFLEMPFDDLHAVLTRRLTQAPTPIFRDNQLVDALVRWVHFSYAERKGHFEVMGALISAAEISVEYLEFLLKEYKLEEWNAGSSKDKSIFKTFTLSYNGCLLDHSSSLTSFSNHQFLTNPSSIHIYVENKVFSINRYKPDGFISDIDERSFCPDSIKRKPRCFVASSESKYLYCLRSNRSFCAYSSIDLSESSLQDLSPLPVNSNLRGVFDERSNSIYFVSQQTDYALSRNRNYSAKYYRAFTDREIRLGIYHYNCEIDQWFSVPQLMKNITSSFSYRLLTTHNDLVYFIDDRYALAYDTRSGQCLKLKKPSDSISVSMFNYCCTVDGKIYVGHHNQIQEFDPSVQRWEIVKIPEPIEENKERHQCFKAEICNMVSYENMLWLFRNYVIADEDNFTLWDAKNSILLNKFGNCPKYYDFSIEVYNPKTRKWHSCDTMSGKTILGKCGFEKSLLDDIIVFKSN